MWRNPATFAHPEDVVHPNKDVSGAEQHVAHRSMSATSGSDDPEGDDGRGPNYRGQSRDAGEDEGTAAAASVLVGGGGGIVAAHHLVDAAQLPEGGLQSLLRSQCFQKGHQRRCCMGALVSGAGSALVNAAMFS